MVEFHDCWTLLVYLLKEFRSRSLLLYDAEVSVSLGGIFRRRNNENNAFTDVGLFNWWPNATGVELAQEVATNL